ncbi:dipeptide ABC transporter ATP-binding protein [Parapusillimonas granuli]|uniref:ABC transporter ATP-binding protein n=1 Tax=Parapusillimonas granuli TaxID=380911 RepID=A0A853FZK4_9BURK|nr:ABC transporter ATP-binding protein [Parapusillimonas granuli]MBB5216467.1 peptide/nickel transport system ATP-binding protein [Parapusillimonas granuli]MEB2399790.1 ABC transporter ATP-binding protein [Alcaligenaceae bacterium]NYT51534.1 ABC transporter ATP-binding protein [Parapusillimonas granuli]
MALLDIKNLHIEFASRRGTLKAIQDVTLAVEKGEILGVVGESGAGKSTIGNAVIGLLEYPGRVTGGEVFLNEERIDNLPRPAFRRVRGRRIGMIFQDPLTSLDPLQTIESQLTETMQVHLHLTHDEARRRAVQLLESVGIDQPELRLRQYPHQFSGGMRQRVVIALALCCEPEVIIADEPTTALDVSIQAQILELLRNLCKEKQMGMILITHDMGVIAEITDRVAVLYRGKLVEEGPTRQVLGAPSHRYTKSLISAVPRSDIKLRRFPMVTYIEDVAEAAVTDDLDAAKAWMNQQYNYEHAGEKPLVEVRDLGMRFVLKGSLIKKHRIVLDAVRNVSFSIKEGEVFGLVGESGSGKSTIARLISGLYQASSGSVIFDGVDVTRSSDKAVLSNFRKQIQMVFQDPFSSLNPRMRILDIVAEPIRFHKLASTEAETRRIVSGLLDYVGLGKQALSRFPHEFSGGQRQRICIARALATRPRFLICDEPTSALDVSIQAQILNLLKDLQESLGLTILFISHDLPVIRQMCDRVGVMRHGELLEVADTETLFQAPRHEYSRHLLSLMPTLDYLSREGLEVEA